MPEIRRNCGHSRKESGAMLGLGTLHYLNRNKLKIGGMLYYLVVYIDGTSLAKTIALFLRTGRAKVLAATFSMVGLIAVLDWAVGNTISLGVLYMIPMMLGAVVMRPSETAAVAVLCSFLRACFDTPGSHAEVILRFLFAVLAYFGSSLFVIGLVRNRALVIEHLGRVEREQALRREAEERLKILVESSPAAVLTLDSKGTVLAANQSANTLLAFPAGQSVQGRAIGGYLPVLADALQLDPGQAGFHTSAQCQGSRENGEIFLAHTWFSSYSTPAGTQLAAIVVDASEEMREHEEENLRQLLAGNRIAAAAVSHEVRNLSGAISILCSHLSARHALAQDEDFQGLTNMVRGLETIASLALQTKSNETLAEVPLREVLDNLRIVIEPDWQEMEGTLLWRFPAEMPTVLADPHGLLQAFLNLVQNSHRAVRHSSSHQLEISISVDAGKAVVRFVDSGPGIPAPELLFQPFQPGADGTGLGLYISRSIVRSYGGELRFEPQAEGSCFAVELQVI